MRWTEFFIPTVREAPADAVVPSHKLMIRAGLIRQVAAGSYSYLPLGYRALRRIEAIVREEMNAAGAIELHMPALHPVELWQQTGRTEAMGDTLIRLPDRPWRKGTVLGPTHEEIVTEHVRAFVNSYKQLPLNLYQIQTKFRDEQRPKSGVLRTREFLMKDAYSFDVDLDALNVSYQKMYAAYERIYARCGLPYIIVEAESGPIGGDASHEFMVETDAGEDQIVRCLACGYAANVDRAACPAPAASADPPSEDVRTEVHTPNARTIDEVCALLDRAPDSMIKTLIYSTADGRTIVGLVRGDHDINPGKLARAADVPTVTLAEESMVRELTGAKVGFAGPHDLTDKGATLIVDAAVAQMRNAATGANRTDYHVTGLNPGRDFPLDHVADIRVAVDGDPCPKCSEPLAFRTCIEVGHVFKLGTKYSDALGATFLDANGKSHSLIMGCYGIGLNRIMAAAIEASHDDDGIIWPQTIAPFDVTVLSLDPKDDAVRTTAEQIHDELTAAGLDVLLDDRDLRPGPKFKDADLIGIPLRITIGKKSMANGVVEFKRRAGGQVQKVPPSEAVPLVRSAAAMPR